MKMPEKSRIVRLEMILALILAISGLAWISAAWASDQAPDQAMRAFIDAMRRKDKAAVLTFFSPTSPWQYMGYEIGTNKVVANKTINYQTMANDFAARKGWYGFFFHEPNGYTFRVNFIDGKMWKKRGPNTFVSPDSDSGRPAITWKQEGGKWVIQKITETTP
jgi:hypothetical protein